MTTQAQAQREPQNGYCLECRRELFFWDDFRKRARVTTESGAYIYLNPGESYKVRCKCGDNKQEIAFGA